MEKAIVGGREKTRLVTARWHVEGAEMVLTMEMKVRRGTRLCDYQSPHCSLRVPPIHWRAQGQPHRSSGGFGTDEVIRSTRPEAAGGLGSFWQQQDVGGF